MTREEEILKAGKGKGYREIQGVSECDVFAFLEGAQWADKHPQDPWIDLDGKHKEPPFGRAINIYYPINGGTVDCVIRKDKVGKADSNGNYISGIDEYGLPVMAESSRAFVLGCYKVKATKWMDIPDPKEPDIKS